MHKFLNNRGLAKLVEYLVETSPSLSGRLLIKDNCLIIDDDIEFMVRVPILEQDEAIPRSSMRVGRDVGEPANVDQEGKPIAPLPTAAPKAPQAPVQPTSPQPEGKPEIQPQSKGPAQQVNKVGRAAAERDKIEKLTEIMKTMNSRFVTRDEFKQMMQQKGMVGNEQDQLSSAYEKIAAILKKRS